MFKHRTDPHQEERCRKGFRCRPQVSKRLKDPCWATRPVLTLVSARAYLLTLYRPSYSYIELATRQIARIATTSKIVVEKSTVPCRTAESMRTILDANSRPGVHFDILSNPEFLAEGTAIADLFAPDRVLIGSLQTEEGLKASAALAGVYANWVP